MIAQGKTGFQQSVCSLSSTLNLALLWFSQVTSAMFTGIKIENFSSRRGLSALFIFFFPHMYTPVTQTSRKWWRRNVVLHNSHSHSRLSSSSTSYVTGPFYHPEHLTALSPSWDCSIGLSAFVQNIDSQGKNTFTSSFLGCSTKMNWVAATEEGGPHRDWALLNMKTDHLGRYLWRKNDMIFLKSHRTGCINKW